MLLEAVLVLEVGVPTVEPIVYQTLVWTRSPQIVIITAINRFPRRKISLQKVDNNWKFRGKRDDRGLIVGTFTIYSRTIFAFCSLD